MHDVGTYPIGDRIRQARNAAKITAKYVAKKLAISRQTYCYLENGQVDPRFSVVLKIAAITEKPMSYFYDLLPADAQEQQKLINASRNQGIVFASTKLAELYDRPDLAFSLLETIGITIDCGREKDAEKLRRIIDKRAV